MVRKTTLILKLGGSIVTRKDAKLVYIRRKLIHQVGGVLKRYLDQSSTQLILLHGAGGRGHRLAQQYGLSLGVRGNNKKRSGALLSQKVNQELNTIVVEILNRSGLATTAIYPPSIIRQKDGYLRRINLAPVRVALAQGLTPVLYGDMVPDDTLELSICSADASSAYLTKAFEAKRLLFATDVDGIFTDDPHRSEDARLIRSIDLESLISGPIKLYPSHSRDVTAGMLGKIQTVAAILKGSQTHEVVVFNGLKPARYGRLLRGLPVIATKIRR
ncbi:MAG: isopentenyl phosphate kinase [Patescibacteria group bacterium]